MVKIITAPKKLSNYAKEVGIENLEKMVTNNETARFSDYPFLSETIATLKETMRENNLKSLSAPQIGVDLRVICIRFGEKDIRTFINPIIYKTTDITFNRESCSSIPKKEYIIPRYNSVVLSYITADGRLETKNFQGKAAYVIQHSIDHIDGLLLSDIGLEIDENFDKASNEEKEELIKYYWENLQNQHTNIQEEIEKDEELKRMNDGINFIQSVQRGETKLVPMDKEEIEAIKKFKEEK